MAFGGILGNGPVAPGGLMGQLQTYMRDNPAAWTTLAGAFMAGRPGFAQLGQTMPGAMRADQMRLEDQRRRNAANMALKALSDASKTNTTPVLPEGIDGADIPEGLLGRFFPSAPDPTDDMREYNAARAQGFNGTFMDYMEAIKRAGAQNINIGQSEYGTIPSGYQLRKNPDGSLAMEPIPGGPAAREEAKIASDAAARKDFRAVSGNIVVEDIDRAISKIKAAPASTTGLGGAILKNIPGTEAANVAALTNTIKANASFDKLQAMREASPTGGALGQVAVQELEMLQAAIGSLEQSQTNDQLIYNLERVREIYLDIIHGKGNRPGASNAPTGGGANQPVFVSPSGVKVFAE